MHTLNYFLSFQFIFQKFSRILFSKKISFKIKYVCGDHWVVLYLVIREFMGSWGSLWGSVGSLGDLVGVFWWSLQGPRVFELPRQTFKNAHHPLRTAVYRSVLPTIRNRSIFCGVFGRVNFTQHSLFCALSMQFTWQILNKYSKMQ